MLQALKELKKYTFIGVLIVNILAIDAFNYYPKKPDFIKSCKINENELSKCSTESIQGIVDHLVKGDLPELSQKIGSLDPRKLEKIIFKPGSVDAITLRAELDDLTLKGLSKMNIKDSRINKKDFSWQTKVLLPRVHLEGKYKMTGKILLIPINGAGNFFIDIDNLNVLVRTTTHLYEKGDFTFFNVTRVRVGLDTTGVRVNFDNLFNGQEEIEHSTNQFFNENWRQLFDALRPFVSEIVENLLVKLLRAIFDSLPANFLVEDIPTSTELYSRN